MQATYSKLKNGSWGIRVVGYVPGVGTSVTVRKKDGSEKEETVEAVVWSGTSDGKPIALCSIKQKTPQAKTSARSNEPRLRRNGTYECEECGDYVRPGTRCWETGMGH